MDREKTTEYAIIEVLQQERQTLQGGIETTGVRALLGRLDIIAFCGSILGLKGRAWWRVRHKVTGDSPTNVRAQREVNWGYWRNRLKVRNGVADLTTCTLLLDFRWKLYSWVIKVPDVDMIFRCCSDAIMVFHGWLLNVNRRRFSRRWFGKMLCKILYLYFQKLFLRLERVWWPFISVPLPSTLSYGEGRMWQVTAYWQWYAYHLDVLSVVLPIYILYTFPIIQLTPPHIKYPYMWWPDEGTFLWAEVRFCQP